MEVHQVHLIDRCYNCPGDLCDVKYKDSQLNALRIHARGHHQIKITLKSPMSPESKRQHRKEQNRTASATFREKHKKKTRSTRSRRSVQRLLYDQEDALLHGNYNCRSPFVEHKKSRIPNAGNGIFALRDFTEGDIITYMSGYLSSDKPKDSSYTIHINQGYFDGLRVPKPNKGLGSFINREDRKLRRGRKNCEFYVETIGRAFTIYIRMIADVKSGDELYITYGRGFRIAK